MPLDLALTDAGFNPKTGRYGFTIGPDGDVLFDSTQAYAVMSSAMCEKGGYPFDATHGTNISKAQSLTRLTPSATPSQAEADILAAEEPLEQAGLIVPGATQVTAKIVPAQPGLSALRIDIAWQTPGGNKQSKTLP